MSILNFHPSGLRSSRPAHRPSARAPRLSPTPPRTAMSSTGARAGCTDDPRSKSNLASKSNRAMLNSLRCFRRGSTSRHVDADPREQLCSSWVFGRYPNGSPGTRRAGPWRTILERIGSNGATEASARHRARRHASARQPDRLLRRAMGAQLGCRDALPRGTCNL